MTINEWQEILNFESDTKCHADDDDNDDDDDDSDGNDDAAKKQPSGSLKNMER